ncbi:MAG TPA: SDR family oxidoreductase [Bryobacteraceae bacterium]|jgi:short-subunit dehydrogenase|nr:SDR family oxidoreductase [Bryobacteraceae bacterium]
MSLDNWKGRWTLITGASAGIGKTFAEVLARGGSNLVLTARRMDRLEALSSQLRSTHSIQVECIAADLNLPDAPGQIFTFTEAKGLSIDFLINNAGFGQYGEFARSTVDRQLSMVQVNCAAVVALTHLYLEGMVERRRGDILILASTASFQAVPYMSVYAATKSFDLLFAEGLAQEVANYGVRVCALCPGATESEFQQVAGSPANRAMRSAETAEQVVRVGLEAISSGKHQVISGFRNRASAEIQRLVPRRVVTNMTEKLFRPR